METAESGMADREAAAVPTVPRPVVLRRQGGGVLPQLPWGVPMSAGSISCDVCGERFGGVATFDRLIDRREDRCKTPREMYRLGFRRDSAGIWTRATIADQAPLIDKRRLSRNGQRMRRGQALSDSRPGAPKRVLQGRIS